jgi:hypothetical protein
MDPNEYDLLLVSLPEVQKDREHAARPGRTLVYPLRPTHEDSRRPDADTYTTNGNAAFWEESMTALEQTLEPYDAFIARLDSLPDEALLDASLPDDDDEYGYDDGEQ